MGGAAAFKAGDFKNLFLKCPALKVQANKIRLKVEMLRISPATPPNPKIPKSP